MLFDAGRLDLRYAARSLRRAPLFTLAAVLSLALAIGATSATFAVVNAVFLRPLPWRDAGQLYLLQRTDARDARAGAAWSYPRVLDVRHNAPPAVQGVAAFAERRVALSSSDGVAARRVAAEFVSADYMSVLGVSPLRGRTIHAIDDAHSETNVALVSERLAAGMLGNVSALGRSIRVNGTPFVVIGIMPDGFAGVSGESDLWLPIVSAPQALGEPDALGQYFWAYSILVRMRAPGTVASARAAMESLTGALRLYAGAGDAGTQLGVVPARDRIVEPGVTHVLLILLGASFCVLLLTCANIANLSLTRLTARSRELAVKAALGASPRRLSRSLAAESALLAITGGVGGLLLSTWATHALWALRPTTGRIWIRALANAQTPALDGRVAAFAAGATLAAGVLLGVIPWFGAARVARGLGFQLSSGDRGGGADARFAKRARQWLATGQVALAFALMSGVFLLAGSIRNLGAADFGFAAGNSFSFRIELPKATYDEARAKALYQGLLDRLAAIPGVDLASLDNTVPLGGAPEHTAATIDAALPVGEGGRGTPLRYHAINPDYFRTMGVRVLRGRSILPRDDNANAPVVVVNEEAARRFWPGRDPVGQQIESMLFAGLHGEWHTAQVVGVVSNVQYGQPGGDPEPDVYTSFAVAPPTTAFLTVHVTHGDPAALLPLARRAVHSLDPNLALDDAATMDSRLRVVSGVARFSTLVLGLYALVAFAIALIGLYSVVAFGVTHRRHEYGIRMALGERQSSIIAGVLVSSARILAIGAMGGVAGSIVVQRLLRHELFAIAAADPRYDLLVLLAFAVAGLAASLIPARAVTRIDPAEALRTD